MKKVIIGLMICTSLCNAKDLGGYGSTYAIAEPNMLETINSTLKAKEKSGEYDEFKNKFQDKVRKSVLEPKALDSLTTTEKPVTHQYKPFYTVSKDIKDSNGLILYAAGTTFNPLDRLTLPKKTQAYYQGVHYSKQLIFFDARDIKQLNFVRSLISELNDKGDQYKLIMTGGNIKDSSAYLDSRVYFDQNGVLSSQMKIQHVPTVVSQNGDHFDLQEFDVKSFSHKLDKVLSDEK